MPIQRGIVSLLGLKQRTGTSTLQAAYLLDSNYFRSDKERWLRWHNRSYRWAGIAEEHACIDADTMYQLPMGRYYALKRGVRVPDEWKIVATRTQVKFGQWSEWQYKEYTRRYKDSR